jgi:hypothetical protein
MRAGRLILVVATLVTILVFPLLIRDALSALRLPNAYAAPGALDPGGRVYQNGNHGGDDNDNNNDGRHNGNNDESDNEGEEGNGNFACFASLNDNEEVPCDFGDNGNANGNFNDGNGNFNDTNGNDNGRRVRSNESVNRPTKCFDTREVGVIQLGTGSYDVTISVLPHSSFGQTTRLTLRPLDPATQPAITGGTLLDRVIYALDAQSSCNGAAIGTLPNNVNMGITFNVPQAVDKSRLQIVRWDGSAWTNVVTVPDPNPGNPYISTTINMAGTYAVIQR